jgi:phosphatidylglycerophosphate synthase
MATRTVLIAPIGLAVLGGAGVVAVWAAFGLPVIGWVAASAYLAVSTVLLLVALRRRRTPRFGWANTVTGTRSALVGIVTGLVAASFVAPIPTPLLIGLTVPALALDAVDGWVARRTDTRTDLGARFDMEVDAFLLLVLSAYVTQTLGLWVLAIGSMRYVFVAAGWAVPWLRGRLPLRYWRKVVTAVQGIALTLAASGLVPVTVAGVLVGVALVLLVESFGRDVLWLAARRPARKRSASGIFPRVTRRPVIAPRRRWFSLAAAILLLTALPLLPGVAAGGDPAGFVRLPWESIIVVLLLALVPRRLARVAVAAAFGLFIVLALVLAGIDAGFESTLDIHFDPLEWQRLSEAFGVVADSIGPVAATTSTLVIAVAIVVLAVAAAWGALRAGAAIRTGRARSMTAASTVAVVWIAAALLGSQLVPGQPAAAAASVDAIAAAMSRAASGLAALADLPRRIAADPYRDFPGSELLTGLRGKDVVFAFVESYGRVAVQDPGLSPGVRQVLRDGEAQLAADGYSSQSAFLTSPTFGGISWLAHSTLQTGLWIDRQSIHDAVMQSDRLTLSGAFRDAGWRTVSVAPSDTEPWPAGTSFYRYDTLYNAHNVGYQGPSFGYAQIPDQYTWKYFADHELAGPHQPVMAEIDLVSSHTPWAPLPQLVPWSEVTDSAVYDQQAVQGQPASVVWQNPLQVRQAYAESIRYSLGAMFSFLEQSGDPDLVLVVLGDHQPATIVSGQHANRDVPISIISKDPAVFHSIADWQWQNGMLPAADAPIWPMSAFRDRLLTAFSPEGSSDGPLLLQREP